MLALGVVHLVCAAGVWKGYRAARPPALVLSLLLGLFSLFPLAYVLSFPALLTAPLGLLTAGILLSSRTMDAWFSYASSRRKGDDLPVPPALVSIREPAQPGVAKAAAGALATLGALLLLPAVAVLPLGAWNVLKGAFEPIELVWFVLVVALGGAQMFAAWRLWQGRSLPVGGQRGHALVALAWLLVPATMAYAMREEQSLPFAFGVLPVLVALPVVTAHLASRPEVDRWTRGSSTDPVSAAAVAGGRV